MTLTQIVVVSIGLSVAFGYFFVSVGLSKQDRENAHPLLQLLLLLFVIVSVLLSLSLPIFLLAGILWATGFLFPNSLDNASFSPLLLLAIATGLAMFLYELLSEPLVKSILAYFHLPESLRLLPEIFMTSLLLFCISTAWTPALMLTLEGALFVASVEVTIGYYMDKWFDRKKPLSQN